MRGEPLTTFSAIRVNSRSEQHAVLMDPASHDFKDRECPTTLEAGLYVIAIEGRNPTPMVVSEELTVDEVW